MPATPGVPRFDELSHRWLNFVERRLAYFAELYRSGRWQHYYTKERFAMLMRNVIDAVKIWRGLAGEAPSPTANENDLRPAA
jgi:uncharacterized repeat protein (TIGR03809 family)